MSDKLSLVSIICLCHNQEAFLAEALQSVWAQTYPHIEMIVVDDASTDNSVEVIKSLLKDKPEIPFIANESNIGNCTSFNKALELSSGEYIIDFSLDDVMHPERVASQVAFFESLTADYGVVYSNALYVDKDGKFLRDHFSESFAAPRGDIYTKLISTWFIPPPTMMFRRHVILELGGYDETLAYEDFDFWVRSARNYKYAYQPQVLTSIRKHSSSFSTRAYARGDKQLHSTYLVCEKIRLMNRTSEEDLALTVRLKYEIRQSVFTANHSEATLFIGMLKDMGPLAFSYKLLEYVNRLKIDLRWMRALYMKFRAGLFSPESHFK